MKLIALSDNPWEIGKNQSVAAGIIGHVKLNLQQLLAALRATSQLRVATSAAARRKSRLAELSGERRARWTQRVTTDRERSGLTATTVAATLAELMPTGAVFCDETVSNRQPFVNLLRFEEPTAYVSGKGGGLGWSMPCAIGLSLGRPRRPVVNVIGDGAFLYYPQTLWSAARLGLGSVVFVVLNNASYRVLKVGVQRMGGPWASSGALPPGLDINAPTVEIATMARTMGVEAERVWLLSELQPALERAFAAGRPYVVECVIDGAI